MIAGEFQLGDDFPPVDFATWRKAAEASLKGIPFERKLISQSHAWGNELRSGEGVRPLPGQECTCDCRP
jgi:hypothetical protein